MQQALNTRDLGKFLPISLLALIIWQTWKHSLQKFPRPFKAFPENAPNGKVAVLEMELHFKSYFHTLENHNVQIFTKNSPMKITVQA